MPRDLFGDVHHPTVRVGSRSRYTVALSLAAHAAIILGIGAATVLGPVVLPGLASSEIVYTNIVLPPPPLPPAPPAPREAAPPRGNPDAAPTEAPSEIRPEPPAPIDTLPTAVHTGVLPGVESFDTVVGEPPPPPPPVEQAPIRIMGGNLRAPKKVRDAPPVYPAIAQAARVEGIVILEATIDVNGQVREARVLRSIPLLDEAALAAVRQWEYTPTLLNGRAVPVVMTVTVAFSLRH
jgi:protein TonB